MKKSFKGFVACLVAVLMIVPAFASALAPIDENTPEFRGPVEARETVSTEKPDVSIRNGRTFQAAEVEAREALAPNDVVAIMVELESAPAADVVSNLKNAGSYRAQLVSEQNKAIAEINSKFSTKLNVTHNYSVLFNGFAFEGEYRLVEEINKLEGMHAFVAPEWETPQLFNTTDQVGAVDAWDLGYTGVGYSVAIIDTGCVVNHPAFSTMPDEASVQYTRNDIANIIAAGNLAGTGRTEMTVDKVYYNAKIPYRWNYYSNASSVAHSASDHGTHVAGIAAGNNDEIKGVAPDAQILVMQVFSPSGGANWTNIVPALEDAAVLGVTSANLSLGSACGSETPYDPSITVVLERCVNAGVNLAIAAGNDYDSAMNNRWGGNEGKPASYTNSGYSLNTDIDNGVVGSPSTWPHGISIAAAQNSKIRSYYIEVDGVKYQYTENAANPVKMADALGGQTLEYVVVPGAGTEEDFAQVDVSGKVALVKRGSINFVVKAANAEAAGAVACVVYNNAEGIMNMVAYEGGKIPHIFIAGESGTALEASAEKQMFVSNDTTLLDDPNANQITDFSSRGLTANMAMKPELTAPGGNIYSSVDPNMENGDLYQAWNGTSMACPHVCGGMAIVSEYVDNNFPNASATEKRNLVSQILMSTATPVCGSNGEYAPVHEQGAGMMSLDKAVTTKAYITVEGTEGNRPKLNLGDDPAKTGSYKATFTVHNFGDTELRYHIEPTVLLNDLALLGTLGDEYIIVYSGETYNILKEEEGEILVGDANQDEQITVVDAVLITRAALGLVDLEANCDLNGDGEIGVADALIAARIALELQEPVYEAGIISNVIFNMPARVVVPAGGEKQVDITFTLKDDIKDYINSNYPNGALLEGFFELMPVEKDPTVVSLTVPFIAFFGDWNYSATIDRGYYYEDVQWNSNNFPNTVGYQVGSDVYGLGINPYVETEDLSYYMDDRNAISPNGDGFLDTVNLLYAGLLRNSYVHYTIVDQNDNELYEIYEEDLCTKGYFMSSGERDQLGVNYGTFPTNIDFASLGEDVIIRVTAKLDNDGAYTTNAFTPEANENWKWDIKVHVDTTAPVISNFTVGDGTIAFDVTDEHYAAAAIVTDGESVKTSQGIFETERGATTSVTLDAVSGDFIVVADYAGNEAWFVFDGTELIPTDKPELPVLPTVYSCSFETNAEINEWSVADADGDGNGWGIRSNAAYDGTQCITSASYNGAALTPDNWAITPTINIPNDQCTFSMYAQGQDPSYAAEHFAVYVGPGDAQYLDQFVEIIPETVTTGNWTEYTADLSAYAGQDIMIAIRHFNCTDMFYLNVDLVRVINNAG